MPRLPRRDRLDQFEQRRGATEMYWTTSCGFFCARMLRSLLFLLAAVLIVACPSRSLAQVTVDASNSAIGGTSHGEFYHQSSGLVSMDGYLTVGNYGGTGKFVQSGSGGVQVGGQLWVGVTINDGVDHIGTGTYLQSGTGSALSEGDIYI